MQQNDGPISDSSSLSKNSLSSPLEKIYLGKRKHPTESEEEKISERELNPEEGCAGIQAPEGGDGHTKPHRNVVKRYWTEQEVTGFTHRFSG